MMVVCPTSLKCESSAPREKESFATISLPLSVRHLPSELWTFRTEKLKQENNALNFVVFWPGVAGGVCAGGDQCHHHGTGEGEGTGARRRAFVIGMQWSPRLPRPCSLFQPTFVGKSSNDRFVFSVDRSNLG